MTNGQGTNCCIRGASAILDDENMRNVVRTRNNTLTTHVLVTMVI